ncbi:hypothetical protein Halxa_1329 [Halopiger xanaduensis SH-6]|uniref:Small CPxCG-related zinc finger protein n=1 Tax=Halopiger xanaduensis (strain DSM 18323 / JCM 14033 / SH-6) TaxID=797210 RepID=F8DBY6_HALXS|nr:hypothetical protein Halxa_1329 [Halopiger xanaduensis SH-6]
MTECPVCDAESAKVYRCSECGADLVGRTDPEEERGR